MISAPDLTKTVATPTAWLLSVIWPHPNEHEPSWKKRYPTEEEALSVAAVVKEDTNKMDPKPTITVEPVNAPNTVYSAK